MISETRKKWDHSRGVMWRTDYVFFLKKVTGSEKRREKREVHCFRTLAFA